MKKHLLFAAVALATLNFVFGTLNGCYCSGSGRHCEESRFGMTKQSPKNFCEIASGEAPSQ